MKKVGLVAGFVLLLVGSIFIVQGIGLLPGSAMTGQALWAVVGAVMVLAGLGLVVWGQRQGLKAKDNGLKG